MIPYLSLEVLTKDEIERIHNATLKILSQTGAVVESNRICDALAEYGAQVDRVAQKVRFPVSIVERFLGESERIDCANIKPAVWSNAGVYQGMYLDPETNLMTPFAESALAKYVKLARSLENVSGIHVLNFPPSGGRPTEPLEVLPFAWKHGADIDGSIQQEALCPFLLEMYQVRAEETGKPLTEVFRGGVFLISPLRLPAHEAAQLLFFHDHGLSVWMSNMITAGGSGPVTLAGCLALNLAERILIGFINRALYGSRSWSLDCTMIAPLDMRTAIQPYGRPEMLLCNLASMQLARHYRVSGSGHGGLTDAKVPSAEAGMQKLLTALPCIFAGGCNIEPGLLSIDEVFSPIQMILDAEAVGAIRRALRGFDVNDETLATDLIHEIGPGGFFTGTEHTAKHFRRELWQTTVWSREMLQPWLAGGHKIDTDYALDIWKDIMSRPDPEPGLSEDSERRLKNIIDKARIALARK